MMNIVSISSVNVPIIGEKQRYVHVSTLDYGDDDEEQQVDMRIVSNNI